MIIELLEKLASDDSAMIVRPADSKDLTLCQKELAEFKLQALPKGYVEFLKIANGFAWNGIMFYSTDQVTDPRDGFTLDDIVSANQNFEYREMPDKILLGRSDEDLFVYDAKQEIFEILDFTAGDQMESFGTFEELFSTVLNERID